MFYAYNQGSKSAKALAQAMDKKRISHKNSKFVGHEDKVVINWGASKLPDEVKKCKVVNQPEAIAIASNKLKFFQAMTLKARTPAFTTDADTVREWLAKGDVVVGREKLQGHSGEGIVIFEGEEDFIDYPFKGKIKVYTKYVSKKQEYRVHVVNGNVVDVRRKALRKDFPKDQANWRIRNHAGGFIFAKEGFETPEDVRNQAIAAVQACGLHFGAVDVVFNDYRQKAYVLEVNTAPGLEGSTIDNYKEAFEQFYKKPDDFFVGLKPNWEHIILEDKVVDIEQAALDF